MKNEFRWKEEEKKKDISSNAEKFLDRYRSLEYVIKEKYQLENWDSAMNFLENRAEFKNLANELRYCREVRNLLSHKPKVKEQYCVEPSDEMLHLLQRVKETLEKPPVIMDIAIPVSKVLYRSPEDKLVDTLQVMNEHSFGNVPILKDGLVCGILSEKAMLNYMVQEKNFHLSDRILLSDLKDHLLLENHRKEYYRFVSQSALISDVSQLFHDALDHGARIGMVFLTQHGRKEEKLLGIVTAWDLASHR